MEGKVLLYDINGVKIGETFIRRAKQLVAQQRAEWKDGGQSAIRFIRDADDWETPAAADKEEVRAATALSRDDDLLMYMAKRNVMEKRGLFGHIIAYIVAWPALFILYFGLLQNVIVSHPLANANDIEGYLDNYTQLFVPAERSREAFEYLDNSVMIYLRWISAYNPHHLWYVILGALSAWGVWIIRRAVKYTVRLLRERERKSSKPDPIVLEYMRLKKMALDE
jgi:hypothetical protein